MSQDTTYSPISFIFDSRGIVARFVTDETPPNTYLNMNDAEEREETAISTRLGSVIINRDPDGTMGGVNYFFDNPLVSLSRLRSSFGTWRYAADSTGLLFRRAGDTQGQYTQIATGLSGDPFSAVVNTCFNSSTPYLFIADAVSMLKDSGTGSPTRIGILPPNYINNAGPYSVKILGIDYFNTSLGGYTINNVSGWSSVAIGNVVSTGTATVVNTFISFYIATGIDIAFQGAVAAVSGNSGSATLARLTDVYGPPLTDQLLGKGLNGSLTTTGVTTFALNSYQGTVAASTTGEVGKTVGIDLSQNNQVTDDDLIVLTLEVSDPGNVQEVRVLFDLNSSGYGAGYYYKSISPQNYQSGVTGDTDPYTTLANQVYAQGLTNGTTNVNLPTGNTKVFQRIAPVDGGEPGGGSFGNGNPLNPVNFATGPGAWLAIYMRRGDFVPVGQAGQDNFTWANVTGWKIQVITNSTGGTTFGLNGLYLQWGAGPSSFGGIGYDYRFTYYDVNTGTESNGSQIMYSSEQFGTSASLGPLIVLREAIGVTSVYSSDPQVTHVRLYRRGGTLASNWYLLDQLVNVTGTGVFFYIDIIPDSALLQANTLVLDNDAPVTSSLPVPISTTLSSPTTGTGPNVYAGFGPQVITVADGTANFVLGQIVVIGTPQNLEEVRVSTPGVGTFQATVRFTHAAGELVQAFSTPAQAVDLVELAYGQMWWAGDPNNPHYLYYSKPGYPENAGPQNYIPVSQPSDPIMAVINFRGTLFVATLTTWYQIIGGASPYAQPTGSKHGLVAKHGWCQTESAIWYQAGDGIREFRGADGAYRTAIIEWLYRDEVDSLSPIPFVDLDLIGDVVMAFQNNYVYVVYPDRGLDGVNSRIAWSTTYNRWRNDSVNATTIYWEADTNLLLYCRHVPAPSGPGYAICRDRVGFVDDMGWLAGNLTSANIPMTLQIPYQDLKKPHFTKQWNMLELDADGQEGIIDVQAVFSDGVVLDLGELDLVGRQKYEFPINAGLGHEAYSMSIVITGYGTDGPPNIYQANIYAALLAANRNTYDTYWIKFGTDESKLVKEGYFDYTCTTPITVSVYSDGSTTAYYTFTLPINAMRSQVPMRVRFPAIKCRQWRCVATADAKFQWWNNPQVNVKNCLVGSGYAKAELTV
jgi:hypothetical protein